MRKSILSLLLVLGAVTPAFAAFTSNVSVLDKEGVAKLSDEKLLDTYMDTVVEIEAVKTFHATSGFSSQQYDDYRALMKYRLQLLMEIHSRNIEIPQALER